MFRVWQTWLDVGSNTILTRQTKFISEKTKGLGVKTAKKTLNQIKQQIIHIKHKLK